MLLRFFWTNPTNSVEFASGGLRMTTIDALHNKYSLVKGAARRARQLQSGAPQLVASQSMKACRVAQDEIKQGQVTFVLNAKIVAPAA
jgi:DNA-directed RNA polymerase subunit omega